MTLLCLQHNKLTSIPAEICNLTNLKTLHLEGNKLAIFPEELCNLINLKYLYIQDNQLTNISSKIVNMASLKLLDLSRNHLEYVPVELGNLAIEHISLFNNKLKQIPNNLLNIKKYLYMNETSYDIDNLDIDTDILIFTDLNTSLTNLPISLREIHFNKKYIKDYNIKLPFGCKIEFF